MSCLAALQLWRHPARSDPSRGLFFSSDCSERRPQTHECSATRQSTEGLPAEGSSAHLSTAEAKDKAVARLVGRFTVSLSQRARSEQAFAAPQSPAQPPQKSGSPQHLSSPTPRHNNRDALRPLGNSKTALRAAAAPARPGPRLARRLGTARGPRVEGGRQPRALHAATR